VNVTSPLVLLLLFLLFTMPWENIPTKNQQKNKKIKKNKRKGE